MKKYLKTKYINTFTKEHSIQILLLNLMNHLTLVIFRIKNNVICYTYWATQYWTRKAVESELYSEFKCFFAVNNVPMVFTAHFYKHDFNKNFTNCYGSCVFDKDSKNITFATNKQKYMFLNYD